MNREDAKNEIVAKVKSLPTLPSIIHRLLPLMQDENVRIDDLIDVVSFDPAISARLLKVANSAYYGFMQKVATVRHAIIVLGLREMKSLALGIAVIDTMKGLKKTTIKHEDLWLHSIGSAMGARILCRSVPGVDSEIVFTASLFHDLGKLIMDGFFNDEYKKVLESTIRGAVMFEAEENVFGFEHGEVGGWLCESWKLPADLVQPVKYHHHLERVDKNWKLEATVVQCADFLCKRAGIGYGCDDKTELIPTDALQTLQIKEDDLGSIIEELAGEKNKAQSFVGAVK